MTTHLLSGNTFLRYSSCTWRRLGVDNKRMSMSAKEEAQARDNKLRIASLSILYLGKMQHTKKQTPIHLSGSTFLRYSLNTMMRQM